MLRAEASSVPWAEEERRAGPVKADLAHEFLFLLVACELAGEEVRPDRRRRRRRPRLGATSSAGRPRE